MSNYFHPSGPFLTKFIVDAAHTLDVGQIGLLLHVYAIFFIFFSLVSLLILMEPTVKNAKTVPLLLKIERCNAKDTDRCCLRLPNTRKRPEQDINNINSHKASLLAIERLVSLPTTPKFVLCPESSQNILKGPQRVS